jgi:hypothetical protein|tara:strand:+ start:465 stop:605 length:141 start_codon:yes stop_codon:yes gene_type:complete
MEKIEIPKAVDFEKYKDGLNMYDVKYGLTASVRFCKSYAECWILPF